MLQKIDDFMIDKVCQPTADRIADKITANSLAGVFFSGACFMTFGEIYAKHISGILKGIDVLYLPFLIYMCFRWYLAEKRVNRQGLMPKERITDLTLRKLIFVLIMVSFFMKTIDIDNRSIKDVFYVFSCLFEILGFYFIACRNNPPKERRSEVWAGKMAMGKA